MIVDSGQRTEFDTGAVRDIQEGKGRCDLLPLSSVCKLNLTPECRSILSCIDEGRFIDAVDLFVAKSQAYKDVYDAILNLAIHFEEGAKKYGDNNWRKGLPISSFVNSGIRHLLKFYRGDTDENHERAFIWNMVCADWTKANEVKANVGSQ